jgi:hypothetical protein
MRFTRRSSLVDVHALMSPSSYHWVNYDDDKFDKNFFTQMDAARGTRLHELAHRLIQERVKLPDIEKTLNMYVNDGIGFGMESEVVLYYSDNCFGTSDCIIFRNNTLRIHDLKNGKTPASMMQLKLYAALFCLEYNYNPFDIAIELRIYQNDLIDICETDPDEIFHLMETIKSRSRRIDALKEEVSS